MCSLVTALAPLGATAAVAASPVNPSDKLCTGVWNHSVATVQFQRAPGGTISWGFDLTSATTASSGPTVTVTMPFGLLDGRAINPP